MYANFKLVGKTIKRVVFGSKGRYIIPVNILKSNSANEYIINVSVNHKYLEKIYRIMLNIHY